MSLRQVTSAILFSSRQKITWLKRYFVETRHFPKKYVTWSKIVTLPKKVTSPEKRHFTKEWSSLIKSDIFSAIWCFFVEMTFFGKVTLFFAIWRFFGEVTLFPGQKWPLWRTHWRNDVLAKWRFGVVTCRSEANGTYWRVRFIIFCKLWLAQVVLQYSLVVANSVLQAILCCRCLTQFGSRSIKHCW